MVTNQSGIGNDPKSALIECESLERQTIKKRSANFTKHTFTLCQHSLFWVLSYDHTPSFWLRENTLDPFCLSQMDSHIL